MIRSQVYCQWEVSKIQVLLSSRYSYRAETPPPVWNLTLAEAKRLHKQLWAAIAEYRQLERGTPKPTTKGNV